MRGKVLALALTWSVLGNSCGYLNVAVNKHILDLSNKESAVRAMYNYSPFGNGVGYRLGHEHFYNDDDFKYSACQGPCGYWGTFQEYCTPTDSVRSNSLEAKIVEPKNEL